MRNQNRPVRIAGASGSASDRRHAISTLAANYPSDPIDVIIGDWMSEGNMTTLHAKALVPGEIAYEPSFLEALTPALGNIEKYGIKVAVNAGASDTKGLADKVIEFVKAKDLNLKIAWIEGDDVIQHIKNSLQNEKKRFKNICTGETLGDWKFKDEIIGAQAYLGGLGIAKAFEEGADIVVAGRVSDASPVIGAAVWWHGWERHQLNELANAFVAGHLIECSNYVCGGNFTGFKNFGAKECIDIGYPIAEIGSKGQVIITKQKETGGIVTVDTCKAQLLYEIQGPWYYNSDVTAVLDQISFEHLDTNRVALKGVKAEAPPPTTKIGITAKGGYQAEVHWFLVGLDILEKARMIELQVRHALGETSRFSVLDFTLNGSAASDPISQNSATVDFRILAQAQELSSITPDKFLRPILDLIMCGYPGSTFNLDFRLGLPKPIFEYYVTLLPQTEIRHVVHLSNGRHMLIESPKVTKLFPEQQPRQDVTSTPKTDFGETVRGPLGWLVHGRSGDKGSNANVGFWVRHQDEYEWLQSILSVGSMKELLADEYTGNQIDRFELPNLSAVHFLLHDHLDRGVSCTRTYDFLGKNVAEFVRSRYVDLPKQFLSRGKL